MGKKEIKKNSAWIEGRMKSRIGWLCGRGLGLEVVLITIKKTPKDL